MEITRGREKEKDTLLYLYRYQSWDWCDALDVVEIFLQTFRFQSDF